MDETPKKQILIIEDEAKIASVMAAELTAKGYAVHAEGSGRAGLTHAASHQPDLVILDLRLPDLDGYAVCQELRKIYHSWVVPVLMVTAMDQPIDKIRGFAHGADAYLTKPFELRDLLQAVTQLCEPTGA